MGGGDGCFPRASAIAAFRIQETVIRPLSSGTGPDTDSHSDRGKPDSKLNLD